MKNKILNILRVLVTLGLLFVIFYKYIDYNILTKNIVDLNFVYLLIALACLFLSVCLTAFRWQILISSQKYKVPFIFLLKEYFIGLFFNNFLPTSVGGDFSRILGLNGYLKNHYPENESYTKLSFTSAFIERVFGFTVLIIVANIGILFLDFSHLTLVKPISLIFLFIGLSAIMCLSFVRLNIISKRLFIKFSFLPKKINNKIEDIFDTFRIYSGDKKNLIFVFSISVIFRLVEGFFVYLIVLSLNLNIDFNLSYIFILIIFAMINILRLFPSINGLGISEVSWITFLASSNVPSEKAILLSLLIYTVSLILSLIGGVFYLLKKHK